MSRVERLPDGSTAFICTRGGQASDRERLNRWVADEAQKQGRCPLCLEKSHSTGDCQSEVVSDATAVAILRGMVQG